MRAMDVGSQRCEDGVQLSADHGVAIGSEPSSIRNAIHEGHAIFDGFISGGASSTGSADGLAHLLDDLGSCNLRGIHSSSQVEDAKVERSHEIVLIEGVESSLSQVLRSSLSWGSVEEDVHFDGDFIAGGDERFDKDLSHDVLSGTESIEILQSSLETEEFAQRSHSSSHIFGKDVSNALLTGDNQNGSWGDEVGVNLFHFGSSEGLFLSLCGIVFAFLSIDAIGIASNVDDLSGSIAFLAKRTIGAPNYLVFTTALVGGGCIALKSSKTCALII